MHFPTNPLFARGLARAMREKNTNQIVPNFFFSLGIPPLIAITAVLFDIKI